MSLIEWNDDLLVGNEMIDGHHQHLVELLNHAHESFVYGMKPGALKRTVKQLIEYAEYHFSAEESLMREHRYPGLEEHLIEHEYFRAKVREMQTKHTGDHHPAYLEITDFLLEWLIAHIKTTDRAVFSYLAEHP